MTQSVPENAPETPVSPLKGLLEPASCFPPSLPPCRFQTTCPESSSQAGVLYPAPTQSAPGGRHCHQAHSPRDESQRWVWHPGTNPRPRLWALLPEKGCINPVPTRCGSPGALLREDSSRPTSTPPTRCPFSQR